MASSNQMGVAVQPAGHHAEATTTVVISQFQQNDASSLKSYNSNYSRVSSILFGFLQIFLCVVTIIGAIAVEIEDGEGEELGTGFWCGAIYAIAGCLAAAAGWYAPKSMLIAVAVFSFLDIPFGIAAVVLATECLFEEINCEHELCRIRNGYSAAGNAVISVCGFWEIVFGLCLLIISCRAICIGSKSQVSSVPVYYSSSAPGTVQLNEATSLPVSCLTTTNPAIPTPQRTTDEHHHYEALHQNKF